MLLGVSITATISSLIGLAIFRKIKSSTKNSEDDCQEDLVLDNPNTSIYPESLNVCDTEKAKNMDIEPYEISHGTYQSDNGFYKTVIFFSNNGNSPINIFPSTDENGVKKSFRDFSIDEIGEKNYSIFINNPESNVMYIRNEKLGIEYELLKDDGR